MHKIVDVIRGLTEFFGNGFQTCENRLTRWGLGAKKRKFENLFNMRVNETYILSNSSMMIILKIINRLTNLYKLF